MKKRKLSKSTPRGLPLLKELDKLMTGLNLWEMDNPPLPEVVVAWGRKVCRSWPISKEA